MLTKLLFNFTIVFFDVPIYLFHLILQLAYQINSNFLFVCILFPLGSSTTALLLVNVHIFLDHISNLVRHGYLASSMIGGTYTCSFRSSTAHFIKVFLVCCPIKRRILVWWCTSACSSSTLWEILWLGFLFVVTILIAHFLWLFSSFIDMVVRFIYSFWVA